MKDLLMSEKAKARHEIVHLFNKYKIDSAAVANLRRCLNMHQDKNDQQLPVESFCQTFHSILNHYKIEDDLYLAFL